MSSLPILDGPSTVSANDALLCEEKDRSQSCRKGNNFTAVSASPADMGEVGRKQAAENLQVRFCIVIGRSEGFGMAGDTQRKWE